MSPSALLDGIFAINNVTLLNERHLKRLMTEYIRYYHDDRTHLGLAKETPASRNIATTPTSASIISMPRLGGLHHRYDLAA
jgi:putative transposase